jgi:hypothetical protein
MQTLAYLKGRRLWVVRDVSVWGGADAACLCFMGLEKVAAASRVMFGTAPAAGAVQDIRFSDLIDHKGNPLPPSIASPRVLVRPRSAFLAFIVGEESGTAFRIARDPDAPGPVNVDLFIYETG